MKKVIIFSVFSAFLLVICNCLPNSIYPASKSQNSIVDSSFVGKWIGDDSSSSACIDISLKKDKWYSINLYENKDSKESSGTFEALLTKISGVYIASIKADVDNIADSSNISVLSMIPAYFFVKIIKDKENTLDFSLFPMDTTEKAINNLCKKYKTIRLENINNQIVFTENSDIMRNILSECLKLNIGFEKKYETLHKIKTK
jgi:hypothetical protein